MAGMCTYSLFYVLGSGTIVFALLGIFAYQGNPVVLMENYRFDDQNLLINEPGIKERVTKQYLLAAVIDLVLCIFIGIKIGRDRKYVPGKISMSDNRAKLVKVNKNRTASLMQEDYLKPLVDQDGNPNEINTNTHEMGLGIDSDSDASGQRYGLHGPIN